MYFCKIHSLVVFLIVYKDHALILEAVMKHLALTVFLLSICLPAAAMQEKNKAISLPSRDDVDRIMLEPRSMINWYTSESLLQTLPCLIPREGTYLTKAIPFQWGTIMLKNRTVLRWKANSRTSLLVSTDQGEQLFVVSPTCVSSEAVRDGKTMDDRAIPTVPYCDLVNKPELYFGKRVRVKAFYTRATEGIYLRGQCAEQPRVGFGFKSADLDETRNPSRKNLRRINDEFGGRAEVVIVGILYDNPSTNPFVSYKYRFEATSLESAKKTTAKIP